MSTQLSEAQRFLRDTEFLPKRADAEFPNARRILEGGLFVSHSGLDSKRIRDQLLEPAIHRLVPGDAAFFHNRRSGGAESYKRLVHAALHWCDKFLIVVSDAAVINEWVIAELDWAIEHTRPIVAACFDGRRLDELRVRCGSSLGDAELYEVDFSADLARAQSDVITALDTLLGKYPLPRPDPL